MRFLGCQSQENNGVVHLHRYGKLDVKKGTMVNALYGAVEIAK